MQPRTKLAIIGTTVTAVIIGATIAGITITDANHALEPSIAPAPAPAATRTTPPTPAVAPTPTPTPTEIEIEIEIEQGGVNHGDEDGYISLAPDSLTTMTELAAAAATEFVTYSSDESDQDRAARLAPYFDDTEIRPTLLARSEWRKRAHPGYPIEVTAHDILHTLQTTPTSDDLENGYFRFTSTVEFFTKSGYDYDIRICSGEIAETILVPFTINSTQTAIEYDPSRKLRIIEPEQHECAPA